MQNEKSKSLHFTEEMDRLSTLLNRHAGEVCLEKELKKAIQAGIPKEKLLEIFYPDVRVEEMRTFRMAYKKGMKND